LADAAQEEEMRTLAIGLVVLTAVGVTACGRFGDQKKAVQTAIEEHLKQRANMMFQNMTLEIREVKFDGDTADAQTVLRSKQSPNIAVGVRYLLRRSGGKWQVESSAPTSGMGTSPHGTTGTMGGNPHDSMALPESQSTPESPTPQSSH
jgi:hypothetical protein